jgi:lipopolysaccharide biosynthesis glycosyltransferase
MPHGPIHVVFSADAGYAAWAGVMVGSVLRFDHGAALHLHMLADRVDPAALRRIAAMAAAKGALLSVYHVGRLLAVAAARLPSCLHLSRATYARLFAADLLPHSVERAIYLDVDVLCRGALGALWAVDLGDAVAAAARDQESPLDPVGDLAAISRAGRDVHARRLALPEDGDYFNAGIMLIHLGRWRDAGIGPASVWWTATHPNLVKVADQDALNCVLRGRVIWLDGCWNVQAILLWQEPGDDVRMLHFAGPDKPWHAAYQGYGAAEWRAVLAASPFHDTPLADGPASDARALLIRGVSAAVETTGIVALLPAHFTAEQTVVLRRPEAALPPGAYTVMVPMEVIADEAARPAPSGGKRARFEVCVMTRSLATLDVEVLPGMRLRAVPVTLGFVLAGPVRFLTCRLSVSDGVCAESTLRVVLTRLPDGWPPGW